MPNKNIVVSSDFMKILVGGNFFLPQKNIYKCLGPGQVINKVYKIVRVNGLLLDTKTVAVGLIKFCAVPTFC